MHSRRRIPTRSTVQCCDNGGLTHRDQPQGALELGESAIAELLSTQGEAVSPVVKTAHEPNLLSNAKPHNRYLALLEPVNLPSLSLDNLQQVQGLLESVPGLSLL